MGHTIVYTAKLANYLIRKGFDCTGVDDNFSNPRYKVFLFDRCPQIEQEIRDYLKRNKPERS